MARRTGRGVSARGVQSRSISWAYEDRVPFDNITAFSGREGVGKSILQSYMASLWSRGGLEGDCFEKPEPVTFLASEDGIEDTWKPRVEIQKADLDLIHFWKPYGSWDITQLDSLRRYMERNRSRILIIESVIESLPEAKNSSQNSNQAEFVRRCLRPLRQWMRASHGAAIFTMHPPKARAASARDMFQASHAWTAMPRTTLFTEWHPDDYDDPDHERRRVMVRGKGNVGKDPVPLEFFVESTMYTHDDGISQEREYIKELRESTVTRDQLLMTPQQRTGMNKVERAMATIASGLQAGAWMPAAPIRTRLAEMECNSDSTVNKAKQRLGVQSKRQGERWFWMLPPKDNVVKLPARPASQSQGQG